MNEIEPIVDEELNAVDLLELEVRRLPGVISVGLTDGDTRTLTVVAPHVVDEEDLRRSVTQVARTYTDEPFVIEIDQNLEKKSTNMQISDDNGNFTTQTVVVDASRPDIESVEVANDTISVKLAWQGRIGSGEASARTLNHAAEATLLALDDLNVPVPFYVRSVTPLGAALRDAVVVVLRSSEVAEERFGVATGDNAREATVRATLDALNRYLAFHYAD